MITLSDPTYYAPFLEPEDEVPARYPAAMRDYERGPAGLGDFSNGYGSDMSEGMDFKEWEFRQTGSILYIGPRGIGPWTALFTPAGTLASLSGSFDPYGRPVVAYSTDVGTAYVWFWPAVGGSYMTLGLAGATSPRVVIPDKRGIVPYETMLFYLKDGKLYGRDLADDFTAETYLADAPLNVNRIGRVGLNGAWRLQIEFRNHL